LLNCPYCNKDISNVKGGSHIHWCKLNPKHNEYLEKLKNVRNNITEESRKLQGNKIKKLWIDGKFKDKIIPNKGKTGEFHHSEETKKRMSDIKKKWINENLDKHTWNINKNKSKPCEIVKNKLNELNIKYIEEYKPMFNKRYFQIDIAFPDKKIGIEINGNQHYNSDGTLKKYYQERHDIIENNGWKLYEFHFSLVYNNFIFNKIDNILNHENIKENFDYDFWINKKLIKEKLKTEKKKEKESIINVKKQIIIDSNIDFSKYGWVKKVSDITNIRYQKVNKWMKKNMIEFYNDKCFIRNTPVSDDIS